MEATILINKINILPNSLKEEVNDFIDFLISKKEKNIEKISNISINKEAEKKLKNIFDASTVESPIKTFEGVNPVEFIREIRDEE